MVHFPSCTTIDNQPIIFPQFGFILYAITKMHHFQSLFTSDPVKPRTFHYINFQSDLRLKQQHLYHIQCFSVFASYCQGQCYTPIGRNIISKGFEQQALFHMRDLKQIDWDQSQSQSMEVSLDSESQASILNSTPALVPTSAPSPTPNTITPPPSPPALSWFFLFFHCWPV